MCNPEEILKYHCPRWHELPDIELYMDQVISVLEKYLSLFAENEQSKTITSTMINNYVKQKIIKPPVNKRYDRVHLAYLFVVCILKRLMQLSEICDAMARMIEVFSIEDAYNIFCDEFEASLKKVFVGETPEKPQNDMDIINVVRAVTDAFAYLAYARYLISHNKESESK